MVNHLLKIGEVFELPLSIIGVQDISRDVRWLIVSEFSGFKAVILRKILKRP